VHITRYTVSKCPTMVSIYGNVYRISGHLLTVSAYRCTVTEWTHLYTCTFFSVNVCALPHITCTDCYGAEQLKQTVCVLRKGAKATKQYSSPCYARAAGVDLSKGDRMQLGPCKKACDTKCVPRWVRARQRANYADSDWIPLLDLKCMRMAHLEA
jgi:hypothetical protein